MHSSQKRPTPKNFWNNVQRLQRPAHAELWGVMQSVCCP
ncbi:hypothetical protein AB205_0214010 [Aquarana catesbeiana]|uniref:Uncharacterized protein n=1 Tax=Aquarana catesbeiana TaxID=8400 RepID=A0A2G9Q981_AQUCT|nr:hypothetical protein AB205_0214010 [Aquarana catesbeiana]